MKFCPINDDPTTLPFTLTSEPFALFDMISCGRTGDGEREHEPDEHDHCNGHEQAGQELAAKHYMAPSLRRPWLRCIRTISAPPVP